MFLLKIFVYFMILEITALSAMMISNKHPVINYIWTPFTVIVGIIILGPIPGILAWATHRLITVALIFYGRKI